jgi:hypothetical protein
LIELSRRTSRPWTAAEIDHARLLAQSLAGTLRVDAAAAALPWSPEAFAMPRAEHRDHR